MSNIINAAIVGLGRWGQRLVESVKEDGVRSTNIRFVSGVTRSPNKVTDFCDQHHIRLYDNYANLLADTTLDAIVLATPHSQHVEQITSAAAAKKHVFVEKPVALDTQGAEHAIRACEQAGVVLAAGFNRRFLPAYQALGDQLKNGSLGQALHIEGNFSGPFGYQYRSDMWRGTIAENPAGGMAAMGIHVLDSMIHLMGPVASVQAQSHRQVINAEIDDTTSVLLQFQSGASGCLSTIMTTAPLFRLQLFGSKAWAEMPNQEQLKIEKIEGESEIIDFKPTNTLRCELEAFAQRIKTAEILPATNAEIINGVASMAAITQSASLQGEKVVVADPS